MTSDVTPERQPAGCSEHVSERSIYWIEASDGQSIRVETYGSGDPAVVLVHGGMCDKSHWAKQLGFLARDWKAVVFDLPGHGESGKDRREWSIEKFGDDVARVVRGVVDTQVVLVGHSMGGLVVLEAARLLGTKVAGVIIVDALHQPSRQLTAPRPPEGADVRTMMKKGMFTASSDPALQDRIVEAMLSAPPEIAGGIRAAAARYDAVSALKAVAALPLAMIFSGLRPVDAADVRACHPDARLWVVKDTGHFLMIEQSELFNQLASIEVWRMHGGLVSL